jgi:hypothetical protein
MNNSGDIIFYYGNPKNPNGKGEQARLIKKIRNQGNFEEWQVEFLDQPEYFYNVLIKKT